MSGKMSSVHYDWLQLIEVSGPFLSTAVLNEAFPNGLDGLDKRVKRDLSRFYSEWVEAWENRHRKFPELHAAWIQSVLRDGLEFHDGDLSAGAEWSVAGEGGLGKFSPDFALRGLDSKPALFIKVLPADAKPDGRDVSDEWKDSVIEKMTRLCRAHEVRLGLVTNGEQWIVVNAAAGGTLSGTATWYARLWFQEDTTLRAFLALLGQRRFTGAPKKRLPFLLDESLKHLEEVTDTLGQQVMTAVEVLMEGFDRADLDSGRTLLADLSPATLYEAALTVMMRLVFLLCAEERGLMLLGEKNYDDAYAVSTLRQKLEEESDKFGPQVLERRYDAWARLLGLFRLVFSGVGHPDLLSPAMGGSLFNPEKYPFLEGRQNGAVLTVDNPRPLPIDNRTVLLILESLQVLKHRDGAIPLSFRSLDVEQIGYIYEGLLEFTGRKADEILLGLKGDKDHQNPEVPLAELESLRLDAEEKLIAYVRERTGRTGIAKEYAAEANLEYLPYLSKICRGDKSLEERVRPFLNWMRTSEWGEPVLYHKGSFYVTEGQDRRSSGTHYTPRALTEMIVKEALEPVVYDGPAQGAPRAEWKLKSPEELLNLKVCDPAMGSGAFLVQACRYLGDRLVEAWSAAEKNGRAVSADGAVTDFPPNEPMSNVPDDRLCIARRLIAEKCLYGVDINPLAVELAKLSLWLVTISKGRPFGFFDHNLKSGDSLLGVSDIEQLTQFRMKPDPHFGGNLMTERIRETIAEAAAEREEIRKAHVRDITDVNLQMAHHARAQKLTAHVRQLADYFIGLVLVLGKPTKKTAAALDAASMGATLLLDPEVDSFKSAILIRETVSNLAYDLPAGQTAARHPFHWAVEFPEVFAQGGFNAIVGNPPFSGGRKLKAFKGETYQTYLQCHIANNVNGSGNADLVSFFFTRSYCILRTDSVFALLASNSIAEGATRESCLEVLVSHGAQIIGTHPNLPWPGTAAVSISPVAVYKPGNVLWKGLLRIHDIVVAYISPYLSAQQDWTPKMLANNIRGAYIGCVPYNRGFILSESEAHNLILNDYNNAKVIVPYLIGEDMNRSWSLKPSNWVINMLDWPLERSEGISWISCDSTTREKQLRSGKVSFDYPFPVAKDFPDVLKILEEKVKPERDNHPEKLARERWWCFQRSRPELYHSLGRGASYAKHPEWWKNDDAPDMFIGTTLTSKHRFFVLLSNDTIIDQTVVAICNKRLLAVLGSNIHIEWANKHGGTLESRLRFTPSDCYETFPFPTTLSSTLVKQGEQYDTLRRQIMTSRKIGLTALYNLFHNPAETDAELEEMRHLQREIDIAVRDSYGWQDIDLGHGFHEVGYLPANDNIRYTISEPVRIEILKRLSALNRQRWEEEEAAGLHKKGKKYI